jgi:uracil-DNA glycosylase
MSLKRKASTLPLSDAKKPKADSSITSFFSSPKTVSPATKVNGTTTDSNPGSAPALKWDKEKWVKTLTAEQKDLLALEIGTLHESWLKELRDEITSPSFLNLKKFLKKEHEAKKKIFPPAMDVYSWYDHMSSKPST